MQHAPPPYGQSSSSQSTGYVPTDQTQSASSAMLVADHSYITRSTGGVLKILEIVLCFIIIICNNVYLEWQPMGGGWVNFVVINAIYAALFLLLVHLYDIPSRIPNVINFRMGELVFHALWSLFWFIAGVVAAARASQYAAYPSYGSSSVAACSVFCFVALVIYLGDTYVAYKAWRQGAYQQNADTPYTPEHQAPTATGGQSADANLYSFVHQPVSAGPAPNFPAAGFGTSHNYPGSSPAVYGEKAAY